MTQPAEPRMFRQRPDGLVEIDTPSGPLPVNATPEQLTAAGLRASDPVSQIPGLAGTLGGNLPATSEERARRAAVGPGIDNSAGLAALRGGAPVIGTGLDEARARQAVSKKGEPPAASDLRDGGARKNVDVPQGGTAGGTPSGPRSQFVKGGDQRVGFTVARTGLRREDIDAAEEAEADASIERKLSAQNISERQGSRVEQASQEMGMQIRREGQAIREQEERNHAMRQEYDKRMASIDMARDRAAKLQDAPTVHWKDDNSFAGIIAKIAVLAAGFAGGDPTLAIGELDKEFDRSIAQKREKWERARTAMKDEQDEFGQLVALYGSPQAAEEELRDRQRLYVQSMGQKMALDAGAVDAADNLRATFADWDDQRAQSRLAREQAIAGNITEQFAYQPDRYVGGARPADEKDVQSLAAAREKAGLGENESSAGNIRDLISEIPEGDVIETNESKNVLSRAGRAATDSLFGRGTSSQWYDSEGERAATSKLGRVKSAIISRLSGANVPPAEYERLAEGINETNTREGLTRYASEVERAIQRRDAGVKAGFRPEVVQTYEQRQRERAPRDRAPGQRSER